MSSLQFEFIKVARASEKTSMLLPYISVHFVWADVCVYVSIEYTLADQASMCCDFYMYLFAFHGSSDDDCFFVHSSKRGHHGYGQV